MWTRISNKLEIPSGSQALDWDDIRREVRSMLFAALTLSVTAGSGHARAFAEGTPTPNTAGNPVPEIPTVTVTAPKPPDPDQLAGDSVPKFIAAHARPSVVTAQLARWREGICPETSGLSPGFNFFVSARIQAVAIVVGAPHKDPGHCKANVRVLFTSEPKQVIEELVKRDPALLGFHYAQQTRRAATFDHAIQGWYMTATQGDRGNMVLDIPNSIQQTTAPLSNPVGRALESGTTPGGRLGTRLATGQSSLLVHALVIVDTKSVSGYAIGSISDYLAMLVLSQTQSPDTCGPLPSILDLMASHCESQEKSDAVTAGDLAFLHALYSADLRENLALEESDILNSMMRQFKAR
jgi:hypothetical protein